jgi:hypothetical protein
MLHEIGKLEDKFSHVLVTWDFNFSKLDWSTCQADDEIDL